MVPLAIDASSPAAFTGTALAITSAAFTPPDGSLVVVSYAANGTTNQDLTITSITNTGAAITWTRRARKNKNAGSDGGAGEPGGAEIWTGVGTGGAITVTVNGVDTGSGSEKFGSIRVVTGQDGSTFPIAVASAASGLPSVARSGCLAGSHVLAVASDWNQSGLGTAGTGQTMIAESNISGMMTMHAWRTTNTLPADGAQTMNLTAPSGQDYNLCALEIRAATSAATATSLVFPRRPRIGALLDL